MAQPFFETTFQTVSVNGNPYMFSDLRIERNTIPPDLYVYNLADNDSDGRPVMASPYVCINYFGTIIGRDPLPVEKTSNEKQYYFLKTDEEYDNLKNAFEDSIADLDDDEYYDKLEEWEQNNYPNDPEFTFLSETVNDYYDYLAKYDALKNEIENRNEPDHNEPELE